MCLGCRSIFDLWRKAASEKGQEQDVHTRIMKRNYEAVPQWWFHLMLVLVVALSLFTCEGFGRQLQLPYWGLLLACAIAFTFTLPIGIITATTNMVKLSRFHTENAIAICRGLSMTTFMNDCSNQD